MSAKRHSFCPTLGDGAFANVIGIVSIPAILFAVFAANTNLVHFLHTMLERVR